MRWPKPSRLVLVFAATWSFAFAPALAATTTRKQTVCTITVNSADEQAAFRRHLPEAKYHFVELVERGRPDWLASACRARVNCDVLIVSGHYDGGTQFFSDRLDVDEYLPVAELERVSCSGSCPGLFSRLKEVYLFGCNTLNPDPQSSASADVLRSLVREGRSPAQAQRELRSLTAAHGESSHDRMRQVFKDVPVIYGFSSFAPLGPVAGATLERHFRAAGAGEVASGRVSRRLLGSFAPFGMAAAQGMTDKDPHLEARQDMCQFADDRLSDATRLSFVHELVQRHMGEARLYLDRVQRLTSSLDGPTRQLPAVEQVLEEIARDTDARTRFLDFARRARSYGVRMRMIDVAQDLGWLSTEERREEIARLLGELQAQPTVGVAEVALACDLNRHGDLDEGAVDPRGAAALAGGDVGHAAVRACLGSAEGRARTLRGLVATQEPQVQIAQAYLRHRPITDVAELRTLAEEVAGMQASDAQVRALEALGRHYLSDPGILDRLTELYTRTPSEAVQAAIAGALIRADLRSITASQLVGTLREHRRVSPEAQDNVIDALINRLQAR